MKMINSDINKGKYQTSKKKKTKTQKRIKF